MSEDVEKLQEEYTKTHERALARLEKARSFDELSGLWRGYSRWHLAMISKAARYAQWRRITEEEYHVLVGKFVSMGADYKSKFREKARKIFESWLESMFRG